MSHFGISGVFPICGCLFLLSVCVFILWASEHDEQVKQWLAYRVVRIKLLIFDVKTCLRCIANGEDL